MTLKDLKQGMICELRNSEEITVANSGYSFTSDLIIFALEKNYNEDLTHKTNKNFDIMKITYGDKVVFERKESRWFVPEFEKEYFFVDNSGDIRIFENSKATLNYEIFNNTRVFKTYEEAEKRLKQQQATLSIERWIAENDVEVDLYDTDVMKWSFTYDIDLGKFIAISSYHIITPKQFILSSEEKASQLIEEREKELKIMLGVE